MDIFNDFSLENKFILETWATGVPSANTPTQKSSANRLNLEQLRLHVHRLVFVRLGRAEFCFGPNRSKPFGFKGIFLVLGVVNWPSDHITLQDTALIDQLFSIRNCFSEQIGID